MKEETTMIKANELRIGNLINHKSFQIRIEAITSEMCSVSGLEQNRFSALMLDKINPIPLTEEWLLKFGFEKKSDGRFNNYVINAGLRKETNLIQLDDKKYCFEHCKFSIHVIDYVHQLQNLIYAITGEELTHS